MKNKIINISYNIINATLAFNRLSIAINKLNRNRSNYSRKHPIKSIKIAKLLKR